jgi:hypothetical protein
MIINKILPLSLIVVIGGMIASCKLDPWTSGDAPTDVVTITKTTRALETGKKGEATYQSQVGAVRMSHKAHMEKGMKCVDCHHKKGNPDREKKCAVCHTGFKGYNTMHGLCVDCHIEHKEGPQMCKECH